MPTLEEISQQAAADCERCVLESMQIDYAWMNGKLDEWVERKYARLMGDERNAGTNPPA
jgi:hypothetical protein